MVTDEIPDGRKFGNWKMRLWGKHHLIRQLMPRDPVKHFDIERTFVVPT
jgi:hypothetical protein